MYDLKFVFGTKNTWLAHITLEQHEMGNYKIIIIISLSFCETAVVHFCHLVEFHWLLIGYVWVWKPWPIMVIISESFSILFVFEDC